MVKNITAKIGAMNMGNLLLALWFLLTGLDQLLHIGIPGLLMAILAMIVGILLLVGR